MNQLCGGLNPHVSTALAERSGIRAVYLSSQKSGQVVSLSIKVGARLPLFYSGIGRAILAGTPQTEREEILRMGIAQFLGQKERMKQGLHDALRDYANFGYSTSFGAWKPEINAIAAPIRSLDGTSIYGINIGGPSFLVSPQELHEGYGERLRTAVEQLGKPLGEVVT